MQPTGGLIARVIWPGLRVGGRLAPFHIHHNSRVNSETALPRWQHHKIILLLVIIIFIVIIITFYSVIRLGHSPPSASSVTSQDNKPFFSAYCTSVVEQTSSFPSGPLSVWFVFQLQSVLRLQPWTCCQPVSWYVPFSAQDLSLFQVFSSLVRPSLTDWLLGKWIGTLLVVFGVVNLVKCPD